MIFIKKKHIVIAGLGPGSKDALTLGVIEALKLPYRIFLRTKIHPVVPWLEQQDIKYSSFDQYYQEAKEFRILYKQIADDILKEVERGPVLYAVPGHPLVAEDTVQLILKGAEDQGVSVEILPAASFLDALFSVVGYDPNNGLQVLDGLAIAKNPPVPSQAAVVTQVYSRMVAGEVKLALMEYYSDHHPVTVVKAAGVPGEQRVEQIPLYKLDRLDWVDHLTSVFIPCVQQESAGREDKCRYSLDPLVNVMAALRGDNGCPWDREQTHQTLKQYLVEETYEVLEALDLGDTNKICEELGDLLLQIVFHAQIAEENKIFNMNNVVEVITEKMIRRHPHVFGDVTVENSDQVLVNWDKIKAQEQNLPCKENSLLTGIPKGLPALIRAAKLQAKAARVGFDWPDYQGAWEKVNEEMDELSSVIKTGEHEKITAELGDVIFAVVNLARLLKIDAEGALTATSDKFIRRFQYIEKRAIQLGLNLEKMSLNEMDNIWDEAKCLEYKENGKNK